MINRSKWIKIFIGIMVSSILLSSEHNLHEVSAFSNQVIQKGATGEDVIELQSRLQYIGFYNGKIDGVFGWRTYWAVRNFQYEFGLKVDGLVGKKTKASLERVTKYHKSYVHEQINKGKRFTHYGGMDLNKQTAPKPQKQQKAKQKQENQGRTPANTPQNQGSGGQSQANQAPPQKPTALNTPGGFSQNDIQLLANAVYGEARGEPYVGQVAIAAVILNRIESPSFPNTVSGVIFEPGAFTAVADGQIWLTPNETAKKAVLDAINGWDPTGNALYYFNPDTATNKWIWSRPQIKKIGKHIFCK
jgi:N-acetylmuramoyl-L-alanine amidase